MCKYSCTNVKNLCSKQTQCGFFGGGKEEVIRFCSGTKAYLLVWSG